MLSIIIPTINEEKNIRITLSLLSDIFRNVIFEVIIVDDNSSDNTVSEIKKFQNKSGLSIRIVNNKYPRGLGNALLIGYNLSKKKFVMFLDADLSIKKNDIYKLYKSKKKNSIVVGSRYLKKSKVIGASILKVLISKLLNQFISFIFKIPICDISHSFRIISKKINLNSENLTHPGFFWETTFNAMIRGFDIEEIPITFIERKFGLSKNYSFKMFKSSVISTFNILIGNK